MFYWSNYCNKILLNTQKNELTEYGNEQNISIKESNLSSDTHDNEDSAVLRRSYLKSFIVKL